MSLYRDLVHCKLLLHVERSRERSRSDHGREVNLSWAHTNPNTNFRVGDSAAKI